MWAAVRLFTQCHCFFLLMPFYCPPALSTVCPEQQHPPPEAPLSPTLPSLHLPRPRQRITAHCQSQRRLDLATTPEPPTLPVLPQYRNYCTCTVALHTLGPWPMARLYRYRQNLPVARTAIKRRNAAYFLESMPRPTPLQPPVGRRRETRIYTQHNYALRNAIPQLIGGSRRPIHLEQPRTVVRVHHKVKSIKLEPPGLVVPEIGPRRLERPPHLAK